MISDFKIERHYNCCLEVFYSDDTSKCSSYDLYEFSSFLDRCLDDPSVVCIKSSTHTDVIYGKIPSEVVI